MRVLSLFSGIGGLELGLEWAGFQTVGQCEIDRACRFWLEEHWPGVPRWADVREVTADAVEAACGAVDVVAGGPPCQPASVAGRRQGSADVRWLWPEFLRVCEEVMPRWIVAENPTGLVSLESGRLFDAICYRLETAGYEVWPVVVGADDVGAPHRRKRVWIVAHRSGGNRAGSSVPLLAGAGQSRGGGGRGRSGELGDPEHDGRGPDEPGREAEGRTALGRTGAPVAHGDERGRSGKRYSYRDARSPVHSQSSWDDADGRGERPVGDTECRGLQGGYERSAGARAEVAPTGCQPRWPARPGEPQWEWEEPRLAQYRQHESDGGEARLRRGSGCAEEVDDQGSPELPLGGSVDGLPLRLARRANRESLKALGNSVVPQVVAVIGKAILDAEARLV